MKIFFMHINFYLFKIIIDTFFLTIFNENEN